MIDVFNTQDDFDKLDGFDDDNQQIPALEPDKAPEPAKDKDKDEHFVDNPFAPEDDSEGDPIEEQQNQIVIDLLKARGIDSPEKVLYEDEDGNVVEKNFFELPYEDQISILKGSDISDLTEEEEYYLSQARQNNLTLTDLIKFHTDKTLQQYIEENSPQQYSVNDYSDEELYMLDMKTRLGDSVTDDEIIKALEREQEAPELFKKKVDAMRTEYLALEEQEKAALAKSIQDKAETQYKEYTDNITSLVQNVEDVGGVILEDTDKNEILDFMLKRDVNGVTEFQKQMQDPESLFLAAWAILKAQDTFDILKEHYEQQLKATKKITPGSKKDEVVVKKTTKKITGMEDLNTFDD